MKKSLLALAVLGAFAGAASAQSSVTLYGKLDMALGKAVGSADKQVRDGAGSRLGFKGVEDLGGGMKAMFGIEHRFDPDTGTQYSTNMWNGYSTVGLGGAFGSVNLGRQYTSAFSLAQNVFDPFGGDTVAGLRATSMTLAPARTRTANSIRYDGDFSGVKIAADIAEHTSGVAGTDRPYSVAAQYAAGPLMAAISYENPDNANDSLTNVGVSYAFGPAKVALAASTGKTTANASVKGYLLGATLNVGPAGRVLVGYAQNRVGSSDVRKQVSLGYRQDLSKRTFLYTDVTRVNKVLSATEQTGYDFGIQHNF